MYRVGIQFHAFWKIFCDFYKYFIHGEQSWRHISRSDILFSHSIWVSFKGLRTLNSPQACFALKKTHQVYSLGNCLLALSWWIPYCSTICSAMYVVNVHLQISEIHRDKEFSFGFVLLSSSWLWKIKHFHLQQEYPVVHRKDYILKEWIHLYIFSLFFKPVNRNFRLGTTPDWNCEEALRHERNPPGFTYSSS